MANDPDIQPGEAPPTEAGLEAAPPIVVETLPVPPPGPELRMTPRTDPRTSPRTIPNLGHTFLFLAIAGAAMVAVQLLALGAVMGLHFFPHESSQQLMRDPRLLVPTMFVSYLVGGLLAIVVLSAVWRKPFAEGVRWDLAPVRRHRRLLLGTGIVTSIIVQVLSNFLPIPKQLPIDDFFRTPMDVWLVALFGVLVAPVCEELAFRGFLLPSLASAWDWVAMRYHSRQHSHLETTHFQSGGDSLPGTLAMPEPSPILAYAPSEDPRWSIAAMVFASTLTSIAFAFLHADQLAHAYAPLAVLFCVSLVLCTVRLRYHSLAASALVHACYNGTIFALLFFATSGFRHLEKLKQ